MHKVCAQCLQCRLGANLNNFNQQNVYDKLRVTYPYKRETKLALNLSFEWEVDFQRTSEFSIIDTETKNKASNDWPISPHHLHLWNRTEVDSSIWTHCLVGLGMVL